MFAKYKRKLVARVSDRTFSPPLTWEYGIIPSDLFHVIHAHVLTSCRWFKQKSPHKFILAVVITAPSQRWEVSLLRNQDIIPIYGANTRL